MDNNTGMSSSVTICPFRNRASLVTPRMIWVMSWHKTWPTASSVLISFMVSSCYIKNPPFVSEKADFLYIKNTLSLSLPKTGFSISAPFQITECRSVSAAAWLLIKSSRELLMFAVSYHEIHGSLVHLTDWIF